MPSNMKKYLITSVTLGLITAGGALLIAGTNMLTRGTIEENKIKTINKGLSTIYGVDTLKTDPATLPEGKKFDYVINDYYVVKDEADAPLGYAFKTEGSNSYGKISLIVGFNADYIYKGVAVVLNEQSFASTLNKKYLNPLVKEGKTVDEVDVSCGATYGAKLVRSMVNSATNAAKYLKGANNG
ncbi:MAG: hypothetical protein IJR08_03125 [Bacilli bacterium]|nr:hypothetical protein [Bacilli bacterium]